MLIDWIHWLSSVPDDQLLLILAPVLLLDIPRYALGSVGLWLVDFLREIGRLLKGHAPEERCSYCPSVCVVIAGLNESATVGYTLRSLIGTYPRLEIIVVDDGSTDGMADVAREAAQEYPEVSVLRKPQRGGKSSALNFALPFTQAEILVCVDSDSHLEPGAIWEIVQPFTDPQVGAVSGTVLARNAFQRVVCWIQALEYLRSIFVGRMIASQLDILGIISGAFGAFRRSAVCRLKGWDVGPGEDGDLTLRLRKSGYRIAFAPYAQCLTNVPTGWWRLMKQRRRWEWAVITFECRKHVDLANPFSPNFRFSNLCLFADRWLFNILAVFMFWAYSCWLLLHPHADLWKLFLLYYLLYLALELVTLGVVLYYSTRRWHDAIVGLAAPLMPFYHVLLKFVSLWAITEEIFFRRSFRDNFVPAHVRQATWHW